jgi:hypothetical protein
MYGYIIFILLIAVGYFNSKQSSKYLCCILILFSALRYDTGWDYMGYIDTIEKTCNGTEEYMRDLGPFWKWIFSLAKYGALWMPISLIAIVTHILIYCSLKLIIGNRDNIIKSALVFYAFFPSHYLWSFSTIRQCLSIAVCLYAFCLFAKKQKIIYVGAFIAISVLSSIYLHSSSIVAIVLVPIWWFFKRINSIWLPTLLTSIIIMAVIFSSQYLSFISMIDKSYVYYASIDDNYGGIMMYLRIIMLLLVIAGYKLIKNENNVNFWFFAAVISMIGHIFITMFIQVAVLTRIWSYLLIVWIIIVGYLVESYRNKLKMINVLYFIFMAILFVAHLIYTQPGALMTSSPFVPYKTIFSLYF